MAKTVLSVLRSFDTASVVFMNIMNQKAIKATGTASEAQMRDQIVQYEQAVRQLYDNLRKLSEKNDNAYVDKSLMNFSITRDEVLKNKKVVDLFLDGDYLWVQLAPLKCYVGELNTTYDIGSHMIRVNLITCELRIFSTKYFLVPTPSKDTQKTAIETVLKRGEYPVVGEGIIPHQHTRANNKPCLGNFSGMVGPVLANCQFNVMIELIIGYIEACNMNDSWGRIALAYPVIEGPGIVPYSKEVYPKMDETRHLYYCCYANSGYGAGDNIEARNKFLEQNRTDKIYTCLEFDTDLIIKSILDLPKDKRTLQELTYQEPVEAVYEDDLVTEYTELTPQEAIELESKGQQVQYLFGVDKDGFPTQTPVIYKNPPANAIENQVFEAIAPTPKPKAPRKSRAKVKAA